MWTVNQQSLNPTRGYQRGVVSVTKTMMHGLLGLMIVLLLLPCRSEGAPVAVRFAEGVTHGFLLLRTTDGNVIATGDLTQIARAGKVESRMMFRFKDGSLFDETVVFTQQRVFAMQSYHLLQSGPAFAQDTEIALQHESGKYYVKTKSHKDGKEEAIDGTLELPADVYNGIVITAIKNLPKGVGATIHLVAFMPKPLLVELEIQPIGQDKMMVGQLAKSATHYVLKPHPGPWLELFAKLLGRMPSDNHVWTITDGAPSFARFEGPLDPTGPVWRIELISPRWPE
jgi:hypothetical protein